MRRLIVLRPEPGASATAAKARKLGLDVEAIPLFELEPVEWEAPDAARFDGLLITSANAVRHAGEAFQQLRGLPVHAVGEATAQAAREAGFGIGNVGEGGVERLLGSIPAELKLLHLCGEDRSDPSDMRQAITAVPVYRARERDAPDLGDVRGAVAMIHSPRAARRFAELVEEKSSIAVAAISPVAAAAAGGGWERVESAGEPSDDALLALAARLCNNLACE
jgi:uroporphyrinogen-III synthase